MYGEEYRKEDIKLTNGVSKKYTGGNRREMMLYQNIIMVKYLLITCDQVYSHTPRGYDIKRASNEDSSQCRQHWLRLSAEICRKSGHQILVTVRVCILHCLQKSARKSLSSCHVIHLVLFFKLIRLTYKNQTLQMNCISNQQQQLELGHQSQRQLLIAIKKVIYYRKCLYCLSKYFPSIYFCTRSNQLSNTSSTSIEEGIMGRIEITILIQCNSKFQKSC